MTLAEIKPFTKDLSLLIVEDEETIRKSLVDIFSMVFAYVGEASNGADGLKLFFDSEKSFDIIFTDIGMPNMSGIEMIKEIRKKNSLVPIIVLSALNDSNLLIELINIGVDSFITKPFTPHSNLNMIYRLASRVSDAKLIDCYIKKIEEQNIALMQKDSELNKYNNKIKEQTIETTQEEIKYEPKQEIDNSDYYDNLPDDDRTELIELVEELEGYVLLSFQNGVINDIYIDHLALSFYKFGHILFRFPIFTNLGSAIFNLSTTINEYKSEFVNKQDFILPFLENLIFVLSKYVEDVWKKPAKNPNFYDASIINDIETFLTLVKGEQENSGNSEDLLEFF